MRKTETLQQLRARIYSKRRKVYLTHWEEEGRKEGMEGIPEPAYSLEHRRKSVRRGVRESGESGWIGGSCLLICSY
jgi:hypothetical protein